VGFIHFTYPKNEKLQTSLKSVTIHEIYVKPPHRRTGIGTQLLKEALEKPRKKGFTNVKLSVLSSNVEAVQFYEKFGFRVYRYGMLKKLC
jgi:ribosomal protein S18 acetylase RimI-like enzyme